MSEAHRIGRRVTAVALALALTAAVLLGLAYIFQRRLIYLPYGELPAVASVLPRAEEVSFVTEDGLELAAWFVVGAGTDPGRRTTLLFLPGNAGNRSYRAPLARRLADAGANVLLVDYRGYGGNPGRPSRDGLAKDARAARAYLAGRDDVAVQRIFYMGESLGAAVAVELATDEPPAGLILRSPFTSLADVWRVHYPFLPVDLLLRDRFSPIERVDDVGVPVLVIAGEDDGTIPVEQSLAVHAAAAEPKRLLVIADADHNDQALLIGDELIAEVRRFLSDVGPGATG